MVDYLSTSNQPADTKTQWNSKSNWIVLAIFTIAAFLIYFPGLYCDFLYDDQQEILQNYSIQTVWPPWIPMFTGNKLPSRPIPYYTFALNYAISAENSFSYHLVDVLLHVLTGYLIYLILKILLQPLFKDSTSSIFLSICFYLALIWLIHPLQTNPVLYIYQRIEQLWSLCLVLSIYFLLKATSSNKFSHIYSLFSLTAIVCGMLSKETMVVAPFILLMIDRIFIAKSWHTLWEERPIYHVLSFATLSILFLLFYFQIDNYAELQDLPQSRWQYILTEAHALTLYLKLAFIPYPLQFDYYKDYISSFSTVAPQFSFIILLLCLSIFLLWKKPALGFWCCWFFFILGPSSSLLPTPNPVCTYRMYLPLLSIAVLVTYLLFELTRILNLQNKLKSTHFPTELIVHSIFIVITIPLMMTTFQRSYTCRSFVSVWTDTAQKLPQSQIPFVQLGVYYFRTQDYKNAVKCLEQAIQINQEDPLILINLGSSYYMLQDYEHALKIYQQSLALKSPHPNTYRELGNTCLKLGKKSDAISYYRKFLEINGFEISTALNLARLIAEQPVPQKSLSFNEFKSLISTIKFYSENNPQIKQQISDVLEIYGDDILIQQYTD